MASLAAERTLSTTMRVLLAGERQLERDYGRRTALHLGLSCAASDCVPLRELRVRLVRQPPGHIVVVFLDGDPATALRTLQQAAVQTHQPVYAVTASPDNAELRAAAQEAGAAGVWPYAEFRDCLLQAIEELRQSGKVPEQRGRIIAVTAATDGAGVTTVAANLAAAIAERDEGVVLAELGTRIPELALQLDLQPQHSLAELIHASARMDASMVHKTAVRHVDGFDVLAYLPETLVAETLTSDIVRDFQVILRNLYRWAVLDAGPQHGMETEEVLRAADLLVVVSRMDPSALRLTRKYIRTLVDNGVAADDVVVVVNRYGQPGQIAWQKSEEALQRKVAAWLPESPRAVHAAMLAGRPVVRLARWSRLSRSLHRLAVEIHRRLAVART